MRTKNLFLVLFIIFGLTPILTCHPPYEKAEFYKHLFGGIGRGEPVAEIGDFTLYSEHLIILYNNLPLEARRHISLRDYLDTYVNQKTVQFEAIDAGLCKNPDILARLELAWNEIFVASYLDFKAKAEITEKQMREYYDKNKDTFFRPERVRVRHILSAPDKALSLVNLLQDDAVGEAEAKKKINMLYEKIKQGEDFARLAQQYSEDTSAPQGGEIGFIGRGATVIDFEKAAFSLKKPGEISGIVNSEFGYHIIQLIEREEKGYMPYEEAKPRIIAVLAPPSDPAEREKYLERMIEALKKRHNVKTYPERLPQ